MRQLIIVLFLVPIFNTLFAQTQVPEQTLFDVLENKNEVFYFKNEFGKDKGAAYKLSEILAVEIPVVESKVDNNESLVNPNNVLIAPVVTPGIVDENSPEATQLKKPKPITYATQGRFEMHKNNGSGDYFIINMNYETNLPTSIDFQTGNDYIVRFIFSEHTGELTEYYYQDSKSVTPSLGQPDVKFISNKIYIYEKESKKIERNLDAADKEKILAKSIILKKLVCNLWHLYAKCKTVDFNISLNKDMVYKKIDSLTMSFQSKKTLGSNKVELYETFKDNKVQIIYSIKKDGINSDRNARIYSLTIHKGEVLDPKIKQEIEWVLRQEINSNTAMYHCLQRTAEGEVSIVIENGKVIEVEVGN